MIDIWNNCYPSNWKGAIVPEAFQHPAKFSSKLIRAIYEHLLAESWVVPGDTILDPFGGIALGALDALRLGLSWRGVELEPHFVELGNQNLALWNQRFATMPKWSGDALLLQGDSRNLAEILQTGQAVVSSPPYADSLNSDNGIDVSKLHGHLGANSQINFETRYGKESGQLGAMSASEAGFQAAVFSPPFSDVLSRDRVEPAERVALARELGISSAAHVSVIEMEKRGQRRQSYAVVSSPPYGSSDQDYKEGWSRFHDGRAPLHANDRQREAQYGQSSGQLGAMRASAKSFQAAVSSPPFQGNGGGTHPTGAEGTPLGDQRLFDRHAASSVDVGYGDQTAGNLGNVVGDDFWSSARTIVEQVYQVLQPNGHAIWVVKDYVKSGQRVLFSDQWRALCESVGFVALHEHHASLVRQNGVSLTLEGGEVQHTVSSKSFFRRLAEKKGSPRIDWETVLCMVKP